MNSAAEGIYKMITERDVSQRNSDASPVFLHLGQSLVAVVRDDPTSAGTLSLMAVFTVRSTGALCGAHGPRRLFITTSALMNTAGMFCPRSSALLLLLRCHITAGESAAYVHVSHPSVEKSKIWILKICLMRVRKCLWSNATLFL